MEQKRYSIKQLNKEYREVYRQTKLFLRRDVKRRSERKAVLNEFVELLLNAQQENMPIGDLFPEGYRAFYQDLISGLSSYSARTQRLRILLTQAILVLFACVIVWQYLSAGGYIGVWRGGIGYIATDFNNYSYSATTVKENYAFQVDFSKWESYRDVVVFQSGVITIKLECLDHCDGRYRIFFRAHGIYSRDGATIVSWRKYSVDETHNGKWIPTAELHCDYETTNYNCHLLGFGGLGKDGEEFSFYVPSCVSDTDVVTFHFVNLTLSRWNRKSETTVTV